jgi:hypothetical protein
MPVFFVPEPGYDFRAARKADMILGASAVAINAATNARSGMSLTVSIGSLFLNFS